MRLPWLDLTFTNLTNYNTLYNAPLTAPMIPPIPPRRLFQPPDSPGQANPPAPTYNVTANYSNASSIGDLNLNGAGGLASYFLADPLAQLISPKNANYAPPIPALATAGMQTNFTPQPANASVYNPSQMKITNAAITLGGNGPYNGANYTQQEFELTGKRQHPYYRTEMLQKVMNLSTVRTHQFAVWITVGFFEVTHVGTPELGLPDVLGAELYAAAGKNVRYRSFFVIDRTKATGFNPYYPGEFRDCVTYRRRIE